MIVARFTVQSRPEHTEEVATALVAVEGPSRALPGVVHFDVARSLTDPNTFFAFEVFADRDAFERQNAQSEVTHVLSLVDAGACTGPYEFSTWETPTTA